MATVIDSLLITLGLDTSKFNDAQKKAVESLRKTDEQAKKTNDNLQRNTKQTTEGFEKAKDAMVSFGTAALSVGAIVNFASKLQNTNMELYNSSKITGKSAVELQSWGNAVEAAGGKTETFINSIKSIQEQLASIPITGDTGLFKFLGPLSNVSGDTGVDVEKHTVNIQKLANAIKKFSELRGVAEAKTIAQGLGFTEQDFIAMLQGGDALSKLEKHYEEVNKSIEQNTELSRKAREEMTNLWTNIEGHGQDALNSLYKTINNISQNPFFTKIINFLDKLLSYAINISPIKGLEILTGEGSLLPSLEKYKKEANAFLDIEEKPSLKPTQQSSSGNAKASSGNAKPLLDYFKSQGWNDVEAAAIVGGLSYESGGLNPKALNPDKVHYGLAQWSPERQADFKNWAGFDIHDARADMMKQAQFVQWELTHTEKAWGAALTKAAMNGYEASKAMFGYERPGDNSLNARNNLASQYYAMTGASATSPMNQNTNNSNTTITIGSIPIHTKATDGVGIAKEIGPAIQNDSLMHFGMVGNR